MTLAHEAFLQEIVEDPESDDPRLIYADYLEERGDPRGEFIRLQCQLAREPRIDHYSKAAVRVRELLGAHKTKWLHWLKYRDLRAEFERGFVVSLAGSATNYSFDSKCPSGWEWQLVRSFSLSDGDLYPKTLIKGWLNYVQRLTFRDRIRRPSILAAWCGQRSDIVELNLWNNALGQSGVRALVDAHRQTHLRKLSINNNGLNDAGAQIVASARKLADVEELQLIGNAIGPQGARALMLSPGLPVLRSLDLYGNQIGDDGIQSLAVHAESKRLRRLTVGNNHIGDRGATAVLNSPHLEQLDYLDLRSNSISYELVRRLRERFGERLLI